MAIVTYPLNGIMYNAENAETYLCTRTSGVYSADDNFSVQADGTMQVTVNPGLAWIKNGDFAGKSVVSTEPVILSFAMADGVLNRKDRIVLRFDVGENATNIVVKQGTPASTAEPKPIERTGTVYELGLYVVDIPAGTLGLSAANITSTMLDEEVCGIMRDGVTGIPTAQLQEQAMALMEQVAESVNQWEQEQTAEFEEWFEGIKGALGEDVAGNLLNMIQQETADRQAADSAIESKLGVNATAVYEESTVKITAPEGLVVVTFLAPSDCKAGDKYTLNGDALTLTDLNGEPVEDGWKQGSPVQLFIQGNKAFFKTGGGGKIPSDLAPLCPNFTVERNGTKVKISADKIQLNALTNMVSGGVWAWGTTQPTKPTGENTKQWSRAELITTPIRALADGTYDLVPDDPALSEKQARVPDIPATPPEGTPIQLKDVPVSNASIKTTIYLKENGEDKPFLYLDADYETSGRGLLLKESVVNQRVVQGSALYESSNMHQACLNWFDTLDNAVKSKVEPVTITYRWKSGSSGYQTKTMEATAFLLTMVNYGYPITSNAYPGKPLPYFNGNGRRQAFIDGTQTISNYYTRDIETYNSASYYWYGCVKADGTIGVLEYNGSYYIRPAITLSPDVWLLDNGDGTYTFAGDEPTPTEHPLEIEIDWPESDPLIARQWVYNEKGVYQTMLLGGVASTEDAPAYSPVLSENTWEQIAQACADHDPILDSWLAGDEKDEVINGETLTFVIVGKDHDDKSDGTGKAKLTFGMTQLMSNNRQMNGSNTNAGSFAGSALYAHLRDTILPGMPEELRAAIKPVNKPTSSGSQNSTIRNDSMSLWLFSEVEIFGRTTNSFGGEGFQYPYFATAANKIKRLFNGAGEVSIWWERSPSRGGSINFCCVSLSGAASTNAASHLYGVCFGFCI